VETLEHIMSTEKPPLSLGQIEKRRNALAKFANNQKKSAEVKASLQEMDKVYLHGRGNLKLWTSEILNEIDAIFVQHFMHNGSPYSFSSCPAALNI